MEPELSERLSLPGNLTLRGTPFGSRLSTITGIHSGISNRSELVIFTHDSANEVSQPETALAIRRATPLNAETNLSNASGLRLLRFGDWIFFYEPGKQVFKEDYVRFVSDAFNLIEYACDMASQ